MWKCTLVCALYTRVTQCQGARAHMLYTLTPPTRTVLLRAWNLLGCVTVQKYLPIHQMQREEKETRWVSVGKKETKRDWKVGSYGFCCKVSQAQYTSCVFCRNKTSKLQSLNAVCWGTAVCVKSIKSTFRFFKINRFFIQLGEQRENILMGGQTVNRTSLLFTTLYGFSPLCPAIQDSRFKNSTQEHNRSIQEHKYIWIVSVKFKVKDVGVEHNMGREFRMQMWKMHTLLDVILLKYFKYSIFFK